MGNSLGSQFQINTYTTYGQDSAAVARDAGGNFVVVWMSDGSNGTDSSSFSIQAQRFDSQGNALGDEFQVNTFTTNSQNTPDVASDALGNFVVVWGSVGSTGTDPDGSIQMQRYDTDGNPIGGELQVNVYTTLPQRAPAVASDDAGNFVVVWESRGSSSSDSSGYSIQAQRFAANGAPLGQFQVNSYTTGDQYRAAVASAGDGRFVVAWDSLGSAGTDTSSTSIQARRYTAAGAALGEFQVNTYTTSSQQFATVAVDVQGEFRRRLDRGRLEWIGFQLLEYPGAPLS